MPFFRWLLMLVGGGSNPLSPPTGVLIGARGVLGVPLHFTLPDLGDGLTATAKLTRNGTPVATGVTESPYYFDPAVFGDVFGVRTTDDFGNESIEVAVTYTAPGRRFTATGRGSATFTNTADDGSSP